MILVTGATGILGRVIVLELLKQGKTVRACKRSGSNLKDVEESFRQYNFSDLFHKIEWIDVDLENPNSISKAFENIKEVYHCAGFVSFNPQHKKKMLCTNIDGTKNLLSIAKKKNLKKLCFISSISTFDGENEFGEIDENCSFNPKLDHSAYAISKHLAEVEVWKASTEGMNVVVVNPGVIIGSGNWNNSSGTLFRSFEQLPFAFSGGTAYVDVRDVAKICTELMNQNIFNEKFILVSENKLFKDISCSIREKLGKSKPRKFPYFLLKFGQILNLFLGWLVPPLKMLNQNNIDAISLPSYFSNKKIVSRLNYQFIPVEESIKYHITNYKSKSK